MCDSFQAPQSPAAKFKTKVTDYNPPVTLVN